MEIDWLRGQICPCRICRVLAPIVSNRILDEPMNALQVDITRFLAGKALGRSRTTYQQLSEAVGWNHPTGRGLGQNLKTILYDLRDRGLPPLTTILVKKGDRHPAPDAMAYIEEALGEIDIERAQQEVFQFDWASVPGFGDSLSRLPSGRHVWLTSFWGFDPDGWGCIGFADEARRSRFLKQAPAGTLVAIYITKGRGPRDMRGNVVGVLEISNIAGHAKEFISGDQWAEKENDPEARGKWLYAVQATRAWRIIPEDWKRVDDLFPSTYGRYHPEFIGASGAEVTDEEAERLLQLDVTEVTVYRQAREIDPTIRTLDASLVPSRAVLPASKPYWVGETDGPKHLYILELTGGVSDYLGLDPDVVEGKSIIKVGFSKSPLTRRDQIQSAYPDGRFKWEVIRPTTIPEKAPYSNARVAVAGEDAMKQRLVEQKADSLGGEFFLVDEGLVPTVWHAGRYAAEQAEATFLKSEGLPAVSRRPLEM